MGNAIWQQGHQHGSAVVPAGHTTPLLLTALTIIIPIIVMYEHLCKYITNFEIPFCFEYPSTR